MLTHTQLPKAASGRFIDFFKQSFLPKFQLTALFTAFFLLVSTAVFSENYTWTGAEDNLWNNENNWEPTGVPSNGDNVQLDGGTVEINDNVTIEGLTFLNGVLSGSGDLTIAGQFYWTGGEITNSGTIMATADFFLDSPNDKTMAGNTLVVNGTGYLLDGSFFIGSGSKVQVVNGGYFLCDHPGNAIIGGFNGGIFELLEGSTFEQAGSGSTEINCVFNSSGASPSAFSVTGGSISMGIYASSSFENCDIVLSEGATMSLAYGVHNFLNPTNMAGGGNLVISGGNAVFQNDGTITCQVDFQDGSIGGGGNPTFGNSFNWQGGVFNLDPGAIFNLNDVMNIDGYFFKNLNSGTLNFRSDCNWSGGDIGIGSGAVFQIDNGANFNIIHAEDQQIGSGLGGQFNLLGQATKFSFNVTTFNTTANIAGLFQVEIGSLQASNTSAFNISGSVVVRIGSSLEILGGTHTVTGNIGSVGFAKGDFIVSGGTVNFLSGTLNTNLTIFGGVLDATAALEPSDYYQTNGTFTGSGSHIVHGDFYWDGGTIAGSGTMTADEFSSFQDGDRTLHAKTLVLNGNSFWNGGNFYIEAGGTLHLSYYCKLKIMHGSNLSMDGDGFIINDGIVDIMYNSASIGDNIIFTNNGMVEGTGTLSFSQLMNHEMVSPGHSVGKITTGTYENADGILSMEVQGNTGPGNGFDQLEITETGELSGTISIWLRNGFVPSPGDEFPLVECANCSGTFSTLDTSKAVLPTTNYWVQDYSNGFTLKVAAKPLPVELIDFEAVAMGKSVELTWETASETNNQGFEIQRSQNGKDWLKIGFVAGAGTISYSQFYQFTDQPEKAGTYYYRLWQMDYDGGSKISPVRTATIGSGDAIGKLAIFPNPIAAGHEIHLRNTETFDEEITVKLRNSVGIVCWQSSTNLAQVQHGLVLSNALPSGIYSVIMTDGIVSETGKLVIH